MTAQRLRTLGSLAIFATGALIAASAGAEEPAPKSPKPASQAVKRTPLVELFTSQG